MDETRNLDGLYWILKSQKTDRRIKRLGMQSYSTMSQQCLMLEGVLKYTQTVIRWHTAEKRMEICRARDTKYANNYKKRQISQQLNTWPSEGFIMTKLYFAIQHYATLTDNCTVMQHTIVVPKLNLPPFSPRNRAFYWCYLLGFFNNLYYIENNLKKKIIFLLSVLKPIQ